MEFKPDITVIVPIYNVEKYINKCMVSLLRQSYKNFEVWAIDDGSPDNSKDIVNRYVEKDSRFKLFFKKNGGYGSVLEYGIQNIETKYFIVCDTDDWLEDTELEELHDLAEKEQLDITIGDKYNIYTDRGNVKAKYVVIATHYPIINMPGFYFTKMYQSTSYLIAIETDKKLPQGMYISAKEPIYSFRTATYNGKQILLIGGSEHKTGKAIEDNSNYEELEKKAKELYPDCKILFKWNTRDCISLDKIPYIGEYSNIMKNMYVGTGFKKWGMTLSNIAGKIVSDKIMGKENKYETIFNSTRIKPIKNRWEVKNMVEETVKSIVLNKFKIEPEDLKQIENDNGAIIEINGENIGIYKDPQGKIYAVKPNCTHLGCLLTWNNLDKTWDCPCHGSRFDYMGRNIYEPAIKDLEIKNIK